jgi:hypothetical protein
LRTADGDSKSEFGVLSCKYVGSYTLGGPQDVMSTLTFPNKSYLLQLTCMLVRIASVASLNNMYFMQSEVCRCMSTETGEPVVCPPA